MGSDVRGAILAMMATIIYYLGFIVFKVAANRMPVLRGTQPIRLLRLMFTNWLWLIGVVVVLAGVATQVAALTMLPLTIAEPIFAASLVFLLFYAVVFFRERLTGREWGSVALFGAATLLIGVSNGEGEVLTSSVAPGSTLAVIVVPALVIAAAVLVGCDVRAFGRHARRLSGVAYGIGSGVSLGLSELSLKGVASAYNEHGLMAAIDGTPYSYVAIGMAVVGFMQLQIGLQRCRISIVSSVFTVTAKTQMAVLGPLLLYNEPWPNDRLLFALRILAFVLALIALALFPRHETVEETSPMMLAATRGRGLGERA
jgi:drug/metabolite transporter (DMT)-like permease